LTGAVSGAALFAAACGPGAEPSPTPSGGSGGLSNTPISVGGATPTPSSNGGGGTTTGETSVSGIPLDPNAKMGGILHAQGATTEGPTFSTWEEAAGIAFHVAHPTHNMVVQTRTWGTEEDYRNLAYFEIHPDLATDWEQSPDGMQWTFNFRDGVEWSDGTPFTCADAQWSLDSIRTGNGLLRSPRFVHWLAVDNIQCPDDLTMVINMKRPKPAMLEVVAAPYNVIRPKHVYENNTDAMRDEPPSVTTGPFTVQQWLPGEKYIFERNPDYWDQPLPYLDGLELSILSDQAADTALRAGRIDIGPAQGLAGGRAETMRRECTVCVFWDRVIGSSTSPAIFLNKERAPWNDPVINQAVALAIDNQKYVTVVQQDWYVTPTGCGYLPGSIWEMPAEQCKQIPGYGDFFEGGDPAADKEKARQLLTDAGYAPNELSVTVRFWSIIQADAPAIIEDLKAIGINAEPEILETARAYDAWTNADFDIGVHSFWIAGLDADFLLYEHFYTGSDRNYNRYSNPEFDRLVDEMSATIDLEQRKQRAWDALEVALRDNAKIIVAHSTYMPVANQKVKGWLPALNYLAGYGPNLRRHVLWLDE
jgi:peptide/nickel transport system substrate-binding protein